LSEQLAAWQLFVTQFKLTQSFGPLHDMPAMHDEQSPPPQSTSDSLPFLVKSLQFAGTHTSLTHEALWQSAPTLQALASAHGGHAAPQSTSVSLPFLTLSPQSGA